MNTDAVNAGLYKELEDVDMSAALTRDDAAQMFWNALQAKTVKYLTDSTGAIEWGKTLLEKVCNAYTVEGILTAIDYNVDSEEYTYPLMAREYTLPPRTSLLSSP